MENTKIVNQEILLAIGEANEELSKYGYAISHPQFVTFANAEKWLTGMEFYVDGKCVDTVVRGGSTVEASMNNLSEALLSMYTPDGKNGELKEKRTEILQWLNDIYIKLLTKLNICDKDAGAIIQYECKCCGEYTHARKGSQRETENLCKDCDITMHEENYTDVDKFIKDYQEDNIDFDDGDRLDWNSDGFDCDDDYLGRQE